MYLLDSRSAEARHAREGHSNDTIPAFHDPWSSSKVSVNHRSTPTDIPPESSSTGRLPWIDRTSLDIAFDRSCFESLDDQLLHHPTQSFADVCWADAVHDVSNDLSASQPPPDVPDMPPNATEFEVPPPTSTADMPTLPFSDKLNTPSKRLAEEHFHAKTDTSVYPVASPSTSRPAPGPAPTHCSSWTHTSPSAPRTPASPSDSSRRALRPGGARQKCRAAFSPTSTRARWRACKSCDMCFDLVDIRPGKPRYRRLFVPSLLFFGFQDTCTICYHNHYYVHAIPTLDSDKCSNIH
ncbi:hypothetical protein C8R43DRAFT_307527 [Mycena crocata]|nr:hypothetical protein C8R43DRAFT_307527 [Mycena crocata]